MEGHSLRRVRRFLNNGAAAAFLFASQPAVAQDLKSFQIERQDLGAALRDFGLQSGESIIFDNQTMKGRRTRGLHGKFSVELGLDELLKGTGFTYERSGGGTLIVKPAPSQSSPLPPAVKSNGGKIIRQINDPGAIEGVVLNEAVGAGLQGVLVRVEGSGATAATDNLGRFRIPHLDPGQYVLEVSYLGYLSERLPVQVSQDGGIEVQFVLVPAQADIVVYGIRSARATSLNMQRTAENSSDVLSADVLGDFTGTTVSESLRRAPGITFQRNAVTGEGENVMVRGLAPDFNTITLNGLQLPVGDGVSRSPSLNNLLTDSIETIVINHTLLPSDNSSGTGGLIEIVTKSPLDYGKSYQSVTLEGGRKAKGFGHNYAVSGTIARSFGSEGNFGLSASVQYRKREDRSNSYNSSLYFGEFLPLETNGQLDIQQEFHIDPRTDFPFDRDAERVFPSQVSVSSSHSKTSTLSVTAAAEWKIGDHTRLSIDGLHSKTTFSGFDASASTSLPSQYVLRPVQELGGELRYALTYDGTASISQSYSIIDDQTNVTDTLRLNGKTELGKLTLNYLAGYAHGANKVGNQQTITLGFGSISGTVIDPSFLAPEAVDPVEGLVISPFPAQSGTQFPLPLLTDAGWDFFNNPDNYYLGGGHSIKPVGSNDRWTGDISARYDLAKSIFNYVELGAHYERSKFRNSLLEQRYQQKSEIIFLPDPPFIDIINPSLAPLNLIFEETDLSRAGLSGRSFQYLSESSVRDFFANIPNLAASADPIVSIVDLPRHPEADNQFTREQAIAAYLQASLQFGRLEVVGGVRYDSVKVNSVQLTAPSALDENFSSLFTPEEQLQLTHLLDESATFAQFLPRVSANFRFNENLILRGSYFMTTARPSITQLSAEERINLLLAPEAGPSGTQPLLSVRRGNPGLRPAVTHNFDLSVEHYDRKIGVIRLSAFYKRINDLLELNATAVGSDLSTLQLPDHPAFQNLPDNLFVEVLRYENNPKPAHIWGVEGHVEKQFTFLPGALGGLGLFANFAYTDSSAAEQKFFWQGSPIFGPSGELVGREPLELRFPNERFKFQSKLSGTIALTYNKYGFDSTLAYSFQNRYRTDFYPNNVGPYTGDTQTLDFRLAYYFGGGKKYRVFFEGVDLLTDANDPDLENTRGPFYTGASYIGGREFRFGLSANF